MPIQSSFPKVAEQVLTLNKNVVELLTKLNSITTSTDQTINVQVFDEKGTLRTFNLPTLSSLKNDIERLNNNIKSMYNIDTTGAIVQTSPGSFKKVVAVDLNAEPAPITSLGTVTNFVATNNWFFDSMINPMLSVEFDLTSQIQDSVRRIQTRRYIVDFERDSLGNLTTAGQSALNSFNNTFRGFSSISITDFETWHKTTPGVLNGTNPKIDDQIFELEPNELEKQGVFSVIKAQEDKINKKLWYYFDTLDYLSNINGKIEKLEVGMELIININRSTTRYRILEISTLETLPKLRFERLEGMDPIAIGTGTMKLYSMTMPNRKVRVSVGYDERNVIFMKAIDGDSHILSTDWSQGTGFWSNDLRLSSTTTANGTTMEQFYIDFVYDYGTVLKDMVVKKIPNALGATPIAPSLVGSNFQVVQINKHSTDTPDSNLLKQKHNYQETLKSEVQQLQDAIQNRNKRAKTEKYKSESARKQALLEIDELSKRKDSKSKLLATITQEILDLSRNPMNKVEPKFAVRGFWTVPDPLITKGSKAQEVVQFRIQYKYLSKDGKESPTQTYQIDNTQNTGAFSNWKEMLTPSRKRIFDPTTGGYTWETQDVSNAELPNINQLDIPIQSNEKVQFRIKSISEVGWPESPLESDWSQIVEIDFPADLSNTYNESETIKNQANKEDLKNTVLTELTSKGLDDHLSQTTVVGNKTFYHDTAALLSGFTDANGVSISLFDYLKAMQDRIKVLEEKILRAKGELRITVLRTSINGTVDEINISNGSTQIFDVECEDYCVNYTETGVDPYRHYANNIYQIRDYQIRVKNISVDSPLGLVSHRKYTNGDTYSTTLPQVFWVDDKDNLITEESSGQTKTQMDNQYVWSVNFESSSSNAQSRVAEDIGNSFTVNNSLASVLSNSSYNVGFSGLKSKLSFVGNNKSLTEVSKWIDEEQGADAQTMFLTSIHPVTPNLEYLVEKNDTKIKTLPANETITIPIKIYFKLNALDNSVNQLNFKYVNLANLDKTMTHTKRIVMYLENEAESKPFRFVLQFNLKRNRIIDSKSGNYGYSNSTKI